MKNIFFVIATALVLSLSACETMKGLGEDIETAGKAIKKKASE
jgi:predicted small secreted protein